MENTISVKSLKNDASHLKFMVLSRKGKNADSCFLTCTESMLNIRTEIRTGAPVPCLLSAYLTHTPTLIQPHNATKYFSPEIQTLTQPYTPLEY